jgi:TPR repeat protein
LPGRIVRDRFCRDVAQNHASSPHGLSCAPFNEDEHVCCQQYPFAARAASARAHRAGTGTAGPAQRLFVGVGMPSQAVQGGERFGLIDRLDEASDLQAVYADLCSQALLGNVAALNDLGWIWLNGKYWRGDTVLAGHLLRMAALQGNAVAWFNLGSSIISARAWRFRMPTPPSITAMPSSAACCMPRRRWVTCTRKRCDGDPPWQVDPLEAYQWFLRGTARRGALPFRGGLPLAARALRGSGHRAALYWLELAAATGVMQAAEELAVHFSSRDTARYLGWRDQAIQLGSTLALTMKLEDQVQR